MDGREDLTVVAGYMWKTHLSAMHLWLFSASGPNNNKRRSTLFFFYSNHSASRDYICSVKYTFYTCLLWTYFN